MGEFGRVHALVVATKATGAVVYERYHERLSELDKAELRAALQQAADAAAPALADSSDYVGAFRGAAFVLIPTADLVFYALGSGEYDELALSGVLRVVMVAIAEAAGKPPTEGVFFERYARICAVVDEVLNEGVLESVDRGAIRKGAKGKAAWE